MAQYAADNSNIVDLITSTGTWEEVQDQVIDYYLTVSFNEDGKVSKIQSNSISYIPPLDEPQGGYTYSWPYDLSVYYLNVDRFYDGNPNNQPSDPNMTGGDFDGLIATITYFNWLGFNMIYTMPIDYFGGGTWGYNHSDIYRIQDSYGDFEDFIEFLKVAKRHNIKVAIDWVPGQIYKGRTHERHPEIFYGERFGAVDGRVCQRMADAIEVMINLTRFWIGLGVDAFRVDNPKFYPDDVSLSHLFFKHWRRKLDRYKPDFWTFGEVPDSAEVVGSFVYYGDQLHGMQDFPIKYAQNDWANGNKSASDYITDVTNCENSYGDKPVMQKFENNHDEDRVYHHLGDDQSISPWRLQALILHIFTFTMVPHLMYGNEMSMWGKKNYTYPGWEYTEETSLFGNTRAMPWDGDGCPSGWETLRNAVRRIVSARAIFPALRTGKDRREQFTEEPAGCLKYWRFNDDYSQKIVVVVNPGETDVTGNVYVGDSDTTFKDWLTDDEFTSDSSGNIVALKIPRHYGRILVRGGYDLATVTGIVSGLNPGTKAIVSIDAPDGTSCSPWTVETDENGYYKIERVIAGTRYIRWWAPGKKYEGMSVTVNPGNNGIDLTLVDDTTPPDVPQGFSARGKDEAVELWWNENQEDDFESYILEYSLSPSGPWNWAAECLGNTFYFNGYDPNNKYYDTGLTNGVTYYFRICAQDRNGNRSSWSEVISAVPHKIRTRFWVDVRDSGYWPNNITKVQIAGNSAALGYAEDTWNPIDMTDNGDGSYEITVEHPPGMIVQYKYLIIDSAGNEIWENDFGDPPDENNREFETEYGWNQLIVNKFNVEGDVEPKAPEDLTVASSSGTLYLGWKKNIEPDLKGYMIERSTYSSSSGFQVIAYVGKDIVSYTDTGLKNGNTYYYRMKAFDEINNYSTYSSVVSGYPSPKDITPPQAPTGLESYGYNGTGCKITWNKTTEADTAGYNIYRATYSNFTPSNSNKLNSSLISNSDSPYYIDLTVNLHTTYYYKITSVDFSGNESSASSALSVYLVNVNFSVDIGRSVNNVYIIGSPYPLSSSGIKLSLSSDYTYELSLSIPADSKIYYKYKADSTVESDFDTPSRYREIEISFQDINQLDDWEEEPDMVENLKSYPMPNKVWLTWSANTEAEDLKGYNIYYSTDANNFNFYAGFTTETEFYIENLQNNTTYFVTVRSVDGGDIELESKNAVTSFSLPKEPVYVKFIVEAGIPEWDNLPKYISIQSGLDIACWVDRGNVAKYSSKMIHPLLPGCTYNYILFVEGGSNPSGAIKENQRYYDTVPSDNSKIPVSLSSTTYNPVENAFYSYAGNYDARRIIYIPENLTPNTTIYVYNNFSSTPTAPSDFAAYPLGKDKIALYWNAPYGFWGTSGEEFKAADVISTGSYHLLRSTYSPVEGFVKIAVLPGDTFSYIDSGLKEGNTYYYIIFSSDCYKGKWGNVEVPNQYSVYSSTASDYPRQSINVYFKVKKKIGEGGRIKTYIVWKNSLIPAKQTFIYIKKEKGEEKKWRKEVKR
ncbi:MAG: hypothetical protein DRI36_04425 [Caldiserica bacterium]|nr:MAG: hypothetical protein DRI36_04425 [Caldisericota bacterium]